MTPGSTLLPFMEDDRRLLGESGNPQALEALEAHKSDPDPAVAQCAASGIEAEEDTN